MAPQLKEALARVMLLGLKSLTAVNESEEDAMAQSILQVYSPSMWLLSTIAT